MARTGEVVDCFCGRRGEITDREPILDESGRWALRCPSCGHIDYLEWLSEEASLVLWGEAKRRRELSVGQEPFAA
jgi:hypothetical protein